MREDRTITQTMGEVVDGWEMKGPRFIDGIYT